MHAAGIKQVLMHHRAALGLALALAALLLTFVQMTVPVQREVFRYVVMVDITQSMNVQDYRGADGRPLSRLAFAKQALHEVLPELPCGSEVGLAVFSEHRAFLLFAPVEVCANLSELTPTIDRLDWRMAWVGNSEVAKGLYEGLRVVQQLDPKAGLVFVTDGHEAPPVSPHYRPAFGGKAGEVKGVIIGAGGLTPVPIPKYEPGGRFIGYWRADEVPQTDPYSQGRPGSLAGEKMVGVDGLPAPTEKPTGNEHLSALREPYLQRLAQETGLAYQRLATVEDLRTALQSPRLGRKVPGVAEVSWAFGFVALACVTAVYAAPLRRERRRAR